MPGKKNLSYLYHTKARTAQQKDPNNNKNSSFLFNPGINFGAYPLLAPLLLLMIHMSAPQASAKPTQNSGMISSPPENFSGGSNFGLGFRNTTTSCQVSAPKSAANISSEYTSITSCLSFKPTSKAKEIYAKTPGLAEQDRQTAIKIMGKISRTKTVGCKIKELCRGENITIKFSTKKDLGEERTIALSSPLDRSMSFKINLKDKLPHKQSAIHENHHLWVARRNLNRKMHYDPRVNASRSIPHAPQQAPIFHNKIQMGLDRLTRLLKLLDNPSPMRPFTEQEQKDWDKLERMQKMAADHYTPHKMQFTVPAKHLAPWVKKGYLDKNFRMISRTGFEFTPDFDQSSSGFVTSIVPLTPKKGTPKENYEYRVSMRTVKNITDRVRAALKDGIWMVKQHIPTLSPAERLKEADAHLRQLYEYTSDSNPADEQDSNIFPILFEELHAHDLEEGGSEFRACLRT